MKFDLQHELPGKWGVCVELEGVVCSTMVEVVAETSDHKSKTCDQAHVGPPFTIAEGAEHHLLIIK